MLTESFPVVAWRSLVSNSHPYGDFLHLNRAALTTLPRRLSPPTPVFTLPSYASTVHPYPLFVFDDIKRTEIGLLENLKATQGSSHHVFLHQNTKPHARVCFLYLSKHCFCNLLSPLLWPWRPTIDKIIVKESWDIT